MTAGNGFGWLQSSGLLWLACIGPVCPTCPTCCCRKKVKSRPKQIFIMAVQHVLIRLVHSAELSDQVRGIPAFQQNVHFLTNIGQYKCGNVLHDPLFNHFLWRSRSGRPNLIFWESKRALALPGLLCIPASVFYRHASNFLWYVFEAGISYCSQASRDLGNWATRLATASRIL